MNNRISLLKGDPIIVNLIEWANHQPLVRDMILTSTRSILNETPGIFSDYDVILLSAKLTHFTPTGHGWMLLEPYLRYKE